MSSGWDPKAHEDRIYAMWEGKDDTGKPVRPSLFHAEPDPAREPYVITIPPPNVTGALHLGHALNNTLQDILIRRKRMQGFNACWLPGTDHAGIATQAVVEKRLREEQGWKRDSSNPEHRKFLVEKIWEWKEEYNTRILNQLRRMGCSCDWERTRFTLDEQCAAAVYETFFRFFKDGLIYRGLRLVNWDTQLQTAVADDEVYHETVRGSLWHIRYPILSGDVIKCESDKVKKGTACDLITFSPHHLFTPPEIDATVARATAGQDAKLGVDYLVVATTRPETMLADTAVAVHPDDERYQHLIGRHVMLPLMNRPIPIIADGMLVKREFGTGCVKVTPGHDPNDYACWQRKQGQPDEIEVRDLLTPDGRIRPDYGPYSGLKKDEARKKIVADLEALGLLEKVEPYETEVGHSDRSKTPIEPLRSEQWFVAMNKPEGPRLAELAMEAVRDGRVRFFPERYAKTYLDWLGEKRDWCISRQLWWGHRIPVWSRTADRAEADRMYVSLDSTGVTTYRDAVVLREDVGADGRIRQQACLIDPDRDAIVSVLEGEGFVRDPDVLDTWFSSALWPHSTFGWPERRSDRETERRSEDAHSVSSSLRLSVSDLDYFYPTSVLSTAREIITLWVARMVMTGLYNLGRVPFQHVYIHAVIQDGQGRRMSKSAGNGVDPLDIIDAYGADALRFTLAQLATETQDIRMPVKPAQLPDGRTVNTSERFELGRNFCNKIYQAAMGFILPNLGVEGQRGTGAQGHRGRGAEGGSLSSAVAIEDRWILSRLSATIDAVDRALDSYHFSDAVQALYTFFWSDFCDWYIELVKPRLMGRDDAGESVRRDDESAAAARRVLAWVLDQSLRLLHPAIPFVTEAVWAELNKVAPRRGLNATSAAMEINGPLIVARWPLAADSPRDADAERELAPLQDVIRALREIRTTLNAIRSQAKQPALRSLPAAVVRCDHATGERLERGRAAIVRLGQVERLSIGPDATKPPQSLSKVLTGIEIYVPIAGLADIDIERKRLAKERDDATGAIQRLEGKLSNEGFVAKAKPEVVEGERTRLAELREKLATIERNAAELGA